jgi:tRNA pseudouridine38-40 synthase
MRTIVLTLEYDGTSYVGWQTQPNGLAVQEVVEKALAEILGHKVHVHASGRTDAGVHARGMVAHFHTETNLPLKAFRDGVNTFLPYDIAIKEVREMPADFHARFSAKGKWYRYTIYRGEVRSPLIARSAWYRRGNLDLSLMRTAAEILVGQHDFKAFRSSSCVAKTTVREIFSIDVSTDNEFIYVDVKGSGFLKNMVRMIVGTLVDVGLGRRPVEDVAILIAGTDKMVCGQTAPACGLCLQQVWY